MTRMLNREEMAEIMRPRCVCGRTLPAAAPAREPQRNDLAERAELQDETWFEDRRRMVDALARWALLAAWAATAAMLVSFGLILYLASRI